MMPCSFLPLSIGDRLVVVAENNGWCYGYRMAISTDHGLFPINTVCEVTRLPISSCTSEGASLVEEINHVMQQWWTRIKELYARHTELHWQDEVLGTIDEMLRARKKIISGGVPAEELNGLRNKISAKIDRGNMLLSLNVTIRRENGAPYEQDSISVIEIYQEHKAAQKRISMDPKEEVENHEDVFSLLFQVQSVKLSQKYDCEFMCALYDVESKCFLTESFRFIWKADTRKFQDPYVRCIFSDLQKEEHSKRLILITRVARIAPIEGTSSTLKKQQDPGPPSLFCRQLIAFDFMDLESFFRNAHPNNEPQEKVIFLNREDSFQECLHRIHVLNKLVKNLNTTKHDEECKIMISCQVLPGTSDTLRTKHPHVFARSPPSVIRRTELLYNGSSSEELRNELFVTLDHGEILGKSSDKNVECRLSVLTNSPVMVQNCFECVEPSGITKRSSYHAYVFLHEDKPKWTEQIKIRLPEDTTIDVHLKMSFYSRRPYDKNKPEKGPFAIAYAKIMDSATLIKDGEHELLVYKVESSHYDESNVSYLSLPENRKILKNLGAGGKSPQTSVFSLSEKSSLIIHTKSCSSILTHNLNLLTIFRWRRNSANLTAALEAVSNPHGQMEAELVKNVTIFLDTLFEIWEDRESLELPIFDALVAMLRLSEEPQQSRMVPILQAYIERFPYTTASLRLIRCVNHYLTSVDSSKNDKTRNTLKVLGKLSQLIVNSKRSADSLCVEIPSFERLIDALLNSFVGLMAEQGERMTVQNTALKHLPSMVAPLLMVYDSVRLTKQLMRIMDNFGPNIVARERLGFVAQLIGDELFECSMCRQILLPKCIEQILCQLDQESDMIVDKEYAERVVECSKIISNLTEKLWPANCIPLGTDDELAYIIVCCYRPIVRAMVLIDVTDGVEDARGHLFSLVLSLLWKMSAQIFGGYIESREQPIDRMDFLMEMVQMLRDLLTKNPYENTWTLMILQQNKIVHKTLRFVMSAIQQFFSNDAFYSDLWQEYMVTLVCFVTQSSLQPENEWLGDENDVRFSLRKAAAKDLRSMWFRLTPTQKMSYIPRLVGAFLKVALIDDDEIREATIPIFFDMIQCEFHSTVHEQKNFKKFSDELIVQLDCLVDQDRGTRAFQRQFTRIMSTQCDSDKELWLGGGRDFIGRVDRLLGHLFEYRLVRETSDCMENGMSRTVQLLRYYEQYGHYELHISYVYKLYDLHILYGNEIEAAMTLLLHADKLSWEDRELPYFLVQKSLNRHCATERQLKDHLLNEVADLYAEGDMWENAIEILRQLEPIYYSIYYDYDKVANLMERIAGLFRKIDMENRAYFYFYLVAFYGKGFPSYLNGKRFVFRSDKLERHGDFIQRMKQIYGGPEEITKMDDFTHLENAPGRYMQVINVDPIGVKIDFGTHINPAIKDYYRHYNIQKFEYVRCQNIKESKWTEVECSELMIGWIEKKIVATNESLPCVLRFSQVVSVSESIMISPLERAVQSVKAKNEKLMESAILVLKNPLQSVRNFSGEVLGVVRPSVMGGVKNYEIFFEERCSKIYDQDEKKLALHLSALIVEQVEVVEFCIYAHGTRAEADRKMHELLIDGFNEHRGYVESKFGKTSSILPTGTSIYDCAAEKVRNAPLSDKKTSSLSMGTMSFDESFSTGTWKKSIQNAIHNATTPRKSNAGVSPVATPPNGNMRVSSDRSLDTSKFERLRAESVDNIRRFVRASPLSLHKKHQSNSSIDGGIKFRVTKKRELPVGPAPPLPARIFKESAENIELQNVHPPRPTRNKLLPDRKEKPQPPTPDRYP